MSKEIVQRREPRGQLAMPGAARDGSVSRCGVAVTDLSTHGCRIIFANNELDNALQVFISLDNLAPQRAHVRWRNRLTAGLEFEQPLYLPVVDHLLAKWKSDLMGEVVPDSSADGSDTASQIETALTLARPADHNRSDDQPGTLNQRPGLGYRMVYR